MDPLRHLDLNLLLALHHLLETASVQAAAAQLEVGQPAMSASLARLRVLLDDPLLLRAGRAMRRTERAEELRAPVHELVDLTRGLLVPVAPFDPAADAWTARVAMSDEIRSWLGPRLAHRVRAEAPRVDLRLRPLTHDSPRAGRTGEIDLAVFPDPVGLPREHTPDLGAFVVRPLCATGFVLATSPHHARGGRPWTIEDYAAADHALVVTWEGTDRGFADDALAQRGHARRVAISVPTFAEAIELVRRDPTLVTLIPEILAPGSGLACGPLPWGERVMRFSYAYHPRSGRDPRSRWLRAEVEAAAAGASGPAGPARGRLP